LALARYGRKVVEAERLRDREPSGDRTSAYEHLTAPEASLLGDGLRNRFVHVTCISANRPRWFPDTYWIGVVIVRRVLAVVPR